MIARPFFLVAAFALLGASWLTADPVQPETVSESSGSTLADPVGLYLTWQRDPTTTMTIDWHTVAEDPAGLLVYRQEGENDWHRAAAESFAFPFSDRTIHRVELTGLDPATSYQFRFWPHPRMYSFRTMPVDATEPIRFVTGGDTRHQKDWMEETNQQALQLDPDFIVWGGDLAYADGREDRLDRWEEWFDAIQNTLITDDGRVIPILVTIGNHEVRGGYYFNDAEFAFDDESRERVAPYFYRLFAMPGHPGYNVLDFGDYLSIVLLDTNHTNPVGGPQRAWLARVLAERQHVPHVFPVYHVTAYPSHRSYHSRTEREIRQQWVPLFESLGVRVAFENHDHTYKRTHPILRGEIHPKGVVYIGDGAWGVGTRTVHDPAETWYLKRAESQRHLILVTLHGAHQHFQVISNTGEIIDEYPDVSRKR
jgi:acid phosphatase type 7